MSDRQWQAAPGVYVTEAGEREWQVAPSVYFADLTAQTFSATAAIETGGVSATGYATSESPTYSALGVLETGGATAAGYGTFVSSPTTNRRRRFLIISGAS